MAERNNEGEFVRLYRGGRMNGWEGGMDNRRDNVDLPVHVLRNAVNVDILTSGKLRRRRGIEQIVADAGAHSIFGAPNFMLWATPTALKKCSPNFSVSVLAASVAYAYPISYVELNGAVYFSSEYINGKVSSLGVLEPWGIVPPTAPPTLVSTDVATTKDREYQVTCTFVTSSGEESGAPTAAKVLCGTSPVIAVTNIPQSSDVRVTHVRVYVTEVDGTMFYRYSDVPVGVTSIVVYSPFAALGKKLESQNMTTMPLGQLVEHLNGRVYVASGSIVYFTEPLRYGLHNPIHGYYMFPERVTLLKAVDGGLFVSADATYFISGSPQPATKGSTVELKPVFPYKAIEGAHCNVPKTHDVMWLSEEGVILGRADGTAVNVTENRIAMDTAERACMGVLERDGFKGVLTMMTNSTLHPATSADYIESEVQRLTEVK